MLTIASSQVVALLLSMRVGLQAAPMGYEYPTPSVPFIEGPVSTTSAPTPSPTYDDYDPNDIPADQAAPTNDNKGYEYPVPENPLVLPTKPPKTTTTTTKVLPECIPVEERDLGMNLELLDAGVPLCPDYDEYNPEDIPVDQAPSAPDCIPAAEQNEGYNPTFLEQGVPLCPGEELPGYEYPVPETPLELPSKPAPTTSAPLPDCIPVEERDIGMNLELLDAGVPLCPDYDEYNPEDIPADQAPPAPDCVPVEEQDVGYNPTFLEQGVPLCPEEELPGYNYPTPENPLTLPPKEPEPSQTTPIPSPAPSQAPTLTVFEDYEEDEEPELSIGYEDEQPGYDQPPTTTSAPLPECIPVEERDLGMNLELLEAGVPLCPDYDEYNPEDIPVDQAPPAPDCVPVEQQDDGYNPTFLEQGVPLCPEEELPGYEYPVPENPLELPTKTTPATTTTTVALPECIEESEKDIGSNPSFIEQGVPLCPEEEYVDEYDPFDVPIDQAPPPPDCIPQDEKDQGYNPVFIESGVPICPEATTGYEYSVPENPLTLPPRKTTTTTVAPIDDYDAYDVPADQAKPAPECVLEEEKDIGPNPQFISEGVPICPSSDLSSYQPQPDVETPAEPSYDDYDPSDIPADQAAPPAEEEQGYSYPVPENPLELPQRRRKSKGLPKDMLPEMGVTVSSKGTVFSFHIPSGHDLEEESKNKDRDSQQAVKDFVTKKNKKSFKKNKSKANKRTKLRKGKSLEDSSSETVDLSEKSEDLRPKKTGIRTISVREWLRRG